MAYNYKRMSKEELIEEEDKVKEQLYKAKKEGKKNYIAIYERKLEVLRSFLVDRKQFQPKDIRHIKNDSKHYFGIVEISGVMAWGYRIDKGKLRKKDDKEAILLSLLGEKIHLNF